MAAEKTILTSENSLNAIFKRTKDSLSTEIEGETVILNMETGKYCGLNEVGTVIWNELEKKSRFEVLKSRILKEFEVSEEDCTNHLITFLKEMAVNNLIEVSVESDR